VPIDVCNELRLCIEGALLHLEEFYFTALAGAAQFFFGEQVGIFFQNDFLGDEIVN